MCDTPFVRLSNMVTNQVTVNPPVPVSYSQIKGLWFHVVYITHHVIKVKKHLHSRIEIVEIKRQ